MIQTSESFFFQNNLKITLVICHLRNFSQFMIRTLNSLRFILILMIVISHSALPMSQGLHDYLGECPVAIFFVISGFVLSLSKGEKLEKEEISNKQFFLSRIFKLYPLHLLIVAFFIPLDWRLGYLESWSQTMAHCFLLQCWVPSHEFIAVLNGPTWFLSDIIFFYLIFKYLYRFIIRNSWRTILPILSIYMIGYILLSFSTTKDYSAGYIYFYPPFRLIDFCLGICLYKFYQSTKGQKLSEKIGKDMSCWQAFIADTIIILMMAAMYELAIHSNPNIRCAALYWLFSIILVFYAVSIENGKGWLSCLLHNKFLFYLGNCSFEIYLWHMLCFRIIQSIALRIYGEDIPYSGIQFMISLSFTIMMAWISKKYIVIPIYNKLKNIACK